VVLAVVLASYWKIVDLETYMRLAIGRFTATAGLGAGDPWIYSVPGLRWRNPEWLGDLLLWWTYRAGGETALVVFKLVVVSLGWLMLYQLARRRGGTPVVIVALALVVLGGSEWHMSERNELHLHWLVPAYGLVLERARRDRRWLWLLAPLGMLWANLHGSFTVGWLLVGAALAEALLGAEPDRALAKALAVALVAHPLLPFVSPEGLRTYQQVIDHFRYAADIKRLIREWQPPDREAATLAQAPLHVLGIVGLLSFLPAPNRRQVGAFVVFAVGLVMAYGAQRFLLLFGLLALPVIAANVSRALPLVGRWPARAVTGALVVGGLVLVAPAVVQARHMPPASDQREYPAKAATWIAAHAPPSSRLFMPYTGSQWLMWKAPQVGLYIHPHFSYSGAHMVRFFDEILPHPDRFDEEVRRFDINLALVDVFAEGRALHAHLDAAPDWALLYFDGFYALYARRAPVDDALIARDAFRVVRARASFDYLAGTPDDALAADLRRLDAEAPQVAAALHAFRLLRNGTGDPAARGRQAVSELRKAIAFLPSSPALYAYLVEAQVLDGDRPAAVTTLQRALALFPQSTRLQAIAAELH
jgi:hypothetical protein